MSVSPLAALLNTWFDTVPRMWIVVGPRRVPAFRSWGIAGFHLALGVAVLTGLRTEVPLAATLGSSAVAGASFFGWGLLRRAVTGHESLVLLELVWVGYGAVAGFAWASGLDVVPLLDLFSVAVAPFLLCGRLGCLTVGCCHGWPAALGPRYSAQHGLPPRLTGRRLFPVQLVEASGLAAITVLSLGLVTRGPGTATVWFLAAYAVLRFGCERLRGDPRPSFLGLPVAQAMCVLQATAVVAAETAWRGSPGDRALVVAAVALAMALVAGLLLRASRPDQALVEPGHLDEVWDLVQHAQITPGGLTEPRVTSGGLRVAASPVDGEWHVSLSHPDSDPLPVALALGGDETFVRRGVVHLRLPATESLSQRVRPREPGPRVPTIEEPVGQRSTGLDRTASTTGRGALTPVNGSSRNGYFDAPGLHASPRDGRRG